MLFPVQLYSLVVKEVVVGKVVVVVGTFNVVVVVDLLVTESVTKKNFR